MEVFRLTRQKYSKELSGKGAALYDNRWNSKGVEMVYTSESRALALAEISVHLAFSIVPSDYVILEISIPDNISILEIEKSILPDDWNTFPYINATQVLGDSFVREEKYGLMKMPSAIVPDEHNYLINLKHPDCKSIKIVDRSPFKFDDRLFK